MPKRFCSASSYVLQTNARKNNGLTVTYFPVTPSEITAQTLAAASSLEEM
jgi:protein tyrosine phosphatase (PTP) superfamily phosphohydrolase (DUF442 family)